MSYLQEHYNQARDAGIEHEVYVVVNDLSAEMATKLKEEYERGQNRLHLLTEDTYVDSYGMYESSDWKGC